MKTMILRFVCVFALAYLFCAGMVAIYDRSAKRGAIMRVAAVGGLAMAAAWLVFFRR